MDDDDGDNGKKIDTEESVSSQCSILPHRRPYLPHLTHSEENDLGKRE